MQTNFATDRNPITSGLYLVDRGALGQPCRWYTKETDSWSLCAYGAEDALAVKDIPTAIGFLPWKGPIAISELPKYVATAALVAGGPSKKALEIVAKAEAKMKVAKVGNTKVGLVQVKPKATKAPKAAKVTHPDGTIFFREDRAKWVVVMDGKQPAARPTKEGVVKWLASKHPEVKPSFI